MLDWIVDTKQVFQRFSHLCKVSWCEVGWEVRGGCCCVSSRLQEMTGTNQDIIGVYREGCNWSCQYIGWIVSKGLDLDSAEL